MKIVGALVVLIVCSFTYCQTAPTPKPKLKPEKVLSEGTKSMMLGGEKLDLEVCLTDEQHRKGLQHHTPLINNQGMLFVYERPEELSYWNPNVPFNIDLAYIGEDGKIDSIHVLLANDETLVDSIKKAKYVLEMREGWFAKKGIKQGFVWEELLKESWLSVE